MIAKVIWIELITQRPAIDWRTSSSARWPDSWWKRLASSGERPIVLPSRMPLIDSDSWTSVDMSAIVFWRRVAMPLRCLPTRRVSTTNSGSSPSEKAASRQSSRKSAMITASTVVPFATTEVAVEVTTSCTPPMSLEMRDCTSPERVRVKKASDIRCRWR